MRRERTEFREGPLISYFNIGSSIWKWLFHRNRGEVSQNYIESSLQNPIQHIMSLKHTVTGNSSAASDHLVLHLLPRKMFSTF